MAFSGEGRGLNKNILVKTIQTMNQHLPNRRLNLTELLAMEKPGIRGKDNTFFIMDKSELKLISESVPRFLWSRLRLPMLIEMSPDFGSGGARIQGEAEVEMVSKILGKEKPLNKQIVIYFPQRHSMHSLPISGTEISATEGSIKSKDSGGGLYGRR